MNRLLIIGLLVLSVTTQAQIPHYDLETTGAEYQVLLQSLNRGAGPLDLENIIAFGKRNLEWLDHINKFQSEKLSFTSKETMAGYPPESPRVYNRQIVIDGYEKLISELPAEMREVLVDQKPFTNNPPIETKEYLMWALKADRAYQIAARWLLLSPYIFQLKARRVNDVRGFYFISNDPDASDKLKNFEGQNQKTKSDYVEWLVGMCINTENNSSGCRNKLATAINNKKAYEFYEKYRGNSEKIYNSFFKIPSGGKYRGLQWIKSNENLAIAPFRDPGNETYRSFLQNNIEDEWRWQDWSLKVSFDNSAKSPITVYWEPGTVPHVPGLGVPEIYMDSNSLLSEWDVQWTIRHEFGHVLGLPDCYHEFYDEDQKVILSYQLDITNLMCSRRGVLQEKHHQELKRAYLN